MDSWGVVAEGESNEAEAGNNDDEDAEDDDDDDDSDAGLGADLSVASRILSVTLSRDSMPCKALVVAKRGERGEGRKREGARLQTKC